MPIVELKNRNSGIKTGIVKLKDPEASHEAFVNYYEDLKNKKAEKAKGIENLTEEELKARMKAEREKKTTQPASSSVLASPMGVVNNATRKAINGEPITTAEELAAVDWDYVNKYKENTSATKAIDNAWNYVSENKGKIKLSVPTNVSSGLKTGIPDSGQGLKTGLDLVQKNENTFNIKPYEPKTDEEKKLYDKYYESVGTLKSYGIDPDNPESYSVVRKQTQVIDKYRIDPDEYNQEEFAKWAVKNGYTYNLDTGWRPTGKTSKEAREDFDILKYFADNNFNKDIAIKYPTLSSVGTVVSAPVRNIAGAMAVVDDTIDTTFGGEINPYSRFHSVGNNTNTIRQTVGDKYASKWFGGTETLVTGNLGRFTYDILMSVGDNVVNLLTAKAIAGGFGLSAAKTAELTSKITSGLVSSGAAADTIASNKLKGYTDEQALALGIASGITEYLTEKIPLDNILKTPKTLVKGALVGFVSEGLEEGAANWANKLTDYIIAGEDSDISMAIEGYIDDGMSKKDAILRAIGDSLLDDTRAMLSGGFSGMGMSAAYHSGNRVKTNILGRKIVNGKYSDVTLSSVLSKGLSSQDADIRKKAEILADMEQGDTKKEQYHYKIGELAMDILADDKYAFTPAGKMENARKLTETVAGKVNLSEKAQSEMLETTALGDLTEAKLPYENIVGLVKYRTDDTVSNYRKSTGRELSFDKIFNANLKAVASKDGVNISDDVIMDYADAFAQSIAKDSTIYAALSEKGDDIAKVIFDTYNQGVSNEDSQTVRYAMERFGSLISELETNSLDMHNKIYGEPAENSNAETAESSNTELTNTAEEGTIEVTENSIDVSPVVNAMTDTLKSGALSNLSRYMESHGQTDVEQFVDMMIDTYRQTGNIDSFTKYFTDGGKTVIEAIENLGGNTYESERIVQGRALRDTADVERTDGERTQEHSEGVPEETGNAQSTASETAVRKQIKDVTYNEVQREAYTEEMTALENENKSKYGVDTVYFTGHAIDGSGTEANGFYYKGTLYLQIDDVHPLRSIRDHEITHNFGKTKAYETFRKAVKAKMSVEQFKAWKEEVRLAYGDVLSAYLAKEFEKSGGTLSNEQLQTLMDDYIEEEMMANLNAESVDFASEYAQEIADFRDGIDSSITTSNAEVSTESKAENKPGEYSEEADAGEIRWQAIKHDNKGGKYWEIETGKDIFRDIKNKKELQKAAFNYILRGDKGEIINEIIDGQQLSFTRVSAEEYVYGSAGKSLTSDNYDKKMRMAPSITDLIENASVEYDTPDHKNHKFAKDGFKNYRGRVRIDDVIFEYVVRVGKNVDKNMFYDINLEVESILPSTKVRQKYKSDSTSNDRVPQNDTSVKNNSMQKNEKIFEDEDIKLSIANSQYMEAVEKGDMETAQKMVEEAAKEAGYSTTKLYHGTGAFGFTKFDLSKSDDNRTIFLTNNERIASTYSGVSGVRKISDVYNKGVDKLSVEDISKELNYFVKEYYKDTFESADYNYSYYNLEKLNNLINVVNDGLVELTSDVEQKISEYADKMVRDSDDTTAKTHRQLVSLKEKLDKWDYHNLSTPIYLLIHHTDALADNSAKYADLEANIRLMNSLRAEQNIEEGVVVEESLGRYSIEIMNKDEAVSKLKSLSHKGNYALYAKMKNSLIIDGKGKNWNEIHNWTGALLPSIDELKLAKEGDHYQLIDAKTGADIQGAVVPITPSIEKESKEQVISFLRSEALHRFAIKYEGKKTTREIAKIAKENGYDSVIIKNITDNGGQNFNVGMEETADIYILFDSNNAKSADPVTYDDNGNVIPLSERFSDSEDIRFSVSFDKSFEEQVDETLSSSTTDRNHVYVGNTTSILKQAGLDNLPMLITKGHLRDMHHEKVDGVTKYHGLSKEIINKIPNMLDYPAIMFDSLTDEKAVCILSDVTDDDGLPILIVIKPNGTGKYNNVEVHSNFVLSAYGKDNPQNLLNMLDNNTDNVLYMSKRKTQDLLKGARLSLPARLSKLRFDYIIHKSNAVVNTKEEPKMSVVAETPTQDRITEIAKNEVFHEELTELARKNKKEFISRVRENKTLKKRLDNANRQMRLTKVPIADRGKATKVIRDIIKEMHGTIKPGTEEYNTMYAEILSIYDEYISAVQNGGRIPEKLQEATDNMVRRFTDVAADIVDSAQEISPAEDYKRLKDWIKSTAIVVPMDVRKEADFANFRKKHFGAFNLTNEGLPVDMAYQELCESFPYVFDDTIAAPADQLNAMADALEALKPEVYNPHAEYIEDAIEHVVSRFVLETDGIARTKDTKADRLVKKAEADKHTALEKQREAFEKKYDRYKEKTEDSIAKLKEQLQGHKYTQYWERRLSAEEKSQAIRNLRDRQKKAAVKAHIRKIVSELKQGLGKTEKNGGIPKELVKAIAEVCSVIDFHTDRTGKNGEPTKASLKLDALQVQYDELKNNPDYDISSEWNEELSQFISKLNTTVRGKRVSDLTLMELSALNDILVEIRHTIANAKKQIGIDNALENREIGIKICDDMNEREDFISSSKKMFFKRNATNVFAVNTLNPMRIAEMISGYNRDSEFYKLFRQLNEGVHRGDMFRMDATKPFDTLMEGPGNQALMYDFLTELHDTGIKDIKGNKVLLPKNMICEIIMLWERKQGRTHLESGGMTLPNLKLFNSGKTGEAYTEGASRTRGITEADISRLRGMLNSYDKAWIEEARILFNEKSQRAINETSMQLVGRNIANAKNYIPIHTDRKFIRTDIEGLKVDATLEGAGSLKSVEPNAKQPVLITGLSYSTSEHIDFVSKYCGLAIPIRNFNKVYNVTFADEDGTAQSVKETIGNKWGTKIQTGVIEQTLRDLQTNRNRANDTVSKVVATIQSNWIGATLSSNPSVSIKQLTSYVTAGSVLGSTPLIKALPYFANTKSTIAEIDKHTGIHFKRRLGYSTQELGDRANKKTGQGLANRLRKAFSQSQLTSWINYLPKGFLPTNWMQSVDCRVAAVLWEASKYYVNDTMKIKPEAENYWSEVTKIYERTIEETQSNYDILHKPEVLKSTNEMTRLVSMFQNDALQGSGLLWNSFNDWNTKNQNYKKDNTKENETALKDAQIRFKQAVFAQMSSALTLATLTLVARALIRKVKPYKDEEKEKVTAESIAKQVGYDTLGNLFTNAIPVLGNLLVSAKDTFVYGYELTSVPAFDTIQEFIEALSGFADMHDKYFSDGSGYNKNEKTDAFLDEAKNIVIAAAPLLGVPLQNAINMVNGVKGYIGDVKEGDFFHDIDDIITTKRRYYSYADLASAISSGNTKQEMKIREYYKNIGVEIQKGSLTTQIKPAYVEYFVDEPHKARELKRKLGLYYGYTVEEFDNWIYTAYINAVISDAQYADEIESAAKAQKLKWNEATLREEAESVYKKLYEESPEESDNVQKQFMKKLKITKSDFVTWESEVKEKLKKKAEKAESERAKFE